MITPKQKPSGGKLSHIELAKNKKNSKTRQVTESSFAYGFIIEQVAKKAI